MESPEEAGEAVVGVAVASPQAARRAMARREMAERRRRGLRGVLENMAGSFRRG
jgi:hypothetical protein